MIVYPHLSELGGCIGRLVADRLGYERRPPPAKFQTLFEAGHQAEDECLSWLEFQGRKQFDQQLEIVLPITDEIVILGHIDSREETLLGMQTNEVKSMGAAPYSEFNRLLWDTPGLVQRYKWQVSGYWHAFNEPVNVIAWNRDWQETDALPQYREVVVEKPFYSMTEIKARVLLAESYVRAGMLPACDTTMRYPCPFYYLPPHADEEVERGDEVIEAMALSYKRFEAEADRWTKLQKEARSEILAWMGDKKKVQTDAVSVSKWRGNGKNVDVEKVKELLGDVEVPYKTYEYDAMRVTPRKTKDAEVSDDGS